MEHCVLILTEQANTMSRCEQQTKDWSKISQRQVEGPCGIWPWHRLGGWFGRRESHSWISLQARAIGLERHPKRQNMDMWLIVYMCKWQMEAFIKISGDVWEVWSGTFWTLTLLEGYAWTWMALAWFGATDSSDFSWVWLPWTSMK